MMTNSPLVFVDCETTGLAPDDDIWEFAAIRRETDGSESEYHWFVEHSRGKCAALPVRFRRDHHARYVGCQALPRSAAAEAIHDLTADRAHIVACGVNYDAGRMEFLFREFGLNPGWHYHLIDVETLAVGWLAGRASLRDNVDQRVHQRPWKSDDLSRVCGVEPPGEGERHTALGDVRWVKRWYDAITGGENR